MPMKYGKIAIEEAWQLPELAHEAAVYAPAGKGQTLGANLVDVHKQRLELMDKYGVEMQVLSLTSPGPQGLSDPVEAAKLATRANDVLAGEVAKNPARFAAFASLSMHDPAEAIKEAGRAIQDLGMVGIILNDFQQYDDKDGTTQMIFYDQPEYDPFWKYVSEELKVPVYIHPRLAIPQHLEQALAGRKWLQASAYYFAHGVSLHLLGLVVNGVFDRFPKLTVIVGHLGEHVVGHRWRVDHRLDKVQSSKGLPMQATLEEYFKRGNIYITTSGHFSTKALAFSIDEIGSERIMFSIDYPYETAEEVKYSCEWWEAIHDGKEYGNSLGKIEGVSEEQWWAMTRGTAIELLGLKLDPKKPSS